MDINDNIDNNSSSAFEQMYISNYHKIRSFCIGYLRDEATSKCVAQEVFISAWTNRENLVFNDNLLPYLFVLAKNKCLNILKREKVKNNYNNYNKSSNRESLNYDALKDSTIHDLYSSDIQALIREAFELMPESVKETFNLSRYKNLKYKEIAKEQNISIKTVEYRIMYALRIFRKVLKDYIPMLLGYLAIKLF